MMRFLDTQEYATVRNMKMQNDQATGKRSRWRKMIDNHRTIRAGGEEENERMEIGAMNAIRWNKQFELEMVEKIATLMMRKWKWNEVTWKVVVGESGK